MEFRGPCLYLGEYPLVCSGFARLPWLVPPRVCGLYRLWWFAPIWWGNGQSRHDQQLRSSGDSVCNSHLDVPWVSFPVAAWSHQCRLSRRSKESCTPPPIVARWAEVLDLEDHRSERRAWPVFVFDLEDHRSERRAWPVFFRVKKYLSCSESRRV